MERESGRQKPSGGKTAGNSKHKAEEGASERGQEEEEETGEAHRSKTLSRMNGFRCLEEEEVELFAMSRAVTIASWKRYHRDGGGARRSKGV